MNKLLIALLMSGALLAGCGKDKAEGEAKEGDKTAASDEAVGVEECDAYIKKAEDCLGKLPAETKTGMEKAVKANRQAWKEAAKDPKTSDTLKLACKGALDLFVNSNPSCK